MGGLFGYDSSKVRSNLKVPSSKGVSAKKNEAYNSRVYIKTHIPGPKITAFQSMMLSGQGLPEIPPGGSLESRLKSRIRRRLQFVLLKQCIRMTRDTQEMRRTMLCDVKDNQWVVRSVMD